MPDDPTRVILPADEPPDGWRWPTRDHDHRPKDRKNDTTSTALQKTLDGLRKL